MASIFISRDISQKPDWVVQLEKEGHDIIGTSCITTAAVPISTIPTCDWIFFSSSEGVRHFLSQKIPTQQKIAAMGKGTADTLLQFQVKSDFIGSSSDPKLVAAEFQKVLGSGDQVLFPQSLQTRNSIAPHLSDCHVMRIPTYETTPIDVKHVNADIYVFSSPSNVQSYLDQHPVIEGKKYIAFGPSTAEALKQYNIDQIIVLQNVSSIELYNTIKLSILGLGT